MIRHRYLLALTPILLSGCAIPPAISIASYVLDGVSYAATGKSVSDHGISLVAGRDCATWRVLKGQNPCQGEPTEIRDPAPVEDGQQATLPTGEPAILAAGTGAPTAGSPSQRYLVLGSYDSRSTADQVAGEYADAKVAVLDVQVGGHAAHRVVAGPLSETEVAEFRQRLAPHDGQRAWEVSQLALEPAPRLEAATPIERH
jgi:hypothetical protein